MLLRIGQKKARKAYAIQIRLCLGDNDVHRNCNTRDCGSRLHRCDNLVDFPPASIGVGRPGQYRDDDLARRYGGDEFDPPAYSDHHKGGLFAGRGSRREKS